MNIYNFKKADRTLKALRVSYKNICLVFEDIFLLNSLFLLMSSSQVLGIHEKLFSYPMIWIIWGLGSSDVLILISVVYDKFPWTHPSKVVLSLL